MILEIDNIELSFGNRKILHGVYLQAEIGKVTGILGKNGSGKTSLLRILFGSLIPKCVNVRIDGVHQHKKLYQTGFVGFLPQHQLLPDHLKLEKAFRYFDVDWPNFITLFPSFGRYGKTKADTLSSGELRAVETYLILNFNKPIILLEEPFSFIAPVYVEKIKNIIQLKKQKSAIIITDQLYRDILEASDTIYLLKEGYSKLIQSKQELEDQKYINLE